MPSFSLWGLVMEKEYGFDLVLRYGVHCCFLLKMGIRVKVEIDVFCDQNLGLGLCPIRRCAFCEKKKLRKKK